MKKRIGTAILSILCFILVLQPVHAAGEWISVASAYVLKDEVQLFLDIPETYDSRNAQAYLESDPETEKEMKALVNTDACAHYIFLVEASKAMGSNAGKASDFIAGINGKERLSNDYKLVFYDQNGLTSENMEDGTADSLETKVKEAEYRSETVNPYKAVKDLYAKLGGIQVKGGDPVYIIMICSGSAEIEGDGSRFSVGQLVKNRHDVMFGSLCMEGWDASNQTAKSDFTQGKAKDYVVGENDKSAMQCGEDFATWADGLYHVSFMLDDDAVAEAREAKLDIKLHFSNLVEYGSEADVKDHATSEKEIRFFGEDPSAQDDPAEPTGADDGQVSGNDVVPDDGQVSDNDAKPDDGTASDNDAVPTEGTASDNDVKPDENVSDNSASENGAVSDNGKPPWSRDRDKDEDEEEKDEKDGLPGYVIPLAIGGVVILAMLVVVIILLTKKKKPSVVNPGMGPDVPPNFEPDAIGSTMAVTPAAAMASAEHSRPSNVDQAEDALLAITVEVYAGHCMRSSAVIYLHDLISFGSDNICDVLFRDPGVEAEHLRISLSEGRVVVEDLSVGGVYVNGMRIQSRNPLRSGDVIGMGEAEFALKWSV